MAVKGLDRCKAFFLNLLIDVCVVIEGQEPAELPERVMLGLRLCYPDFKNVACHIDEILPSLKT